MAQKKQVAESYVLRELGQVRALTDPLRQRLLRAFAGEPQTTKQIAHSLRENPTKLYHHVNKLARARLLRLVRTQQKRGTTERYYQATAKQFAVHRDVFRHLSGKKAGPEALFENAFSNALSEIRENIGGAGKGRTALLQARICASHAEAVTMRKKVQAVIQRSTGRRKTRRGKAPTETFEILFAIYPVQARKRRKSR